MQNLADRKLQLKFVMPQYHAENCNDCRVPETISEEHVSLALIRISRAIDLADKGSMLALSRCSRPIKLGGAESNPRGRQRPAETAAAGAGGRGRRGSGAAAGAAVGHGGADACFGRRL